MKNIIFLLFFVFFFSCRKKNIETPEQTAFANLLACVNSKDYPVMPKTDIYMEGEMDGKYFSISNSGHLGVRNTLRSFFALGYRTEYANTKEFQGNGFAVYSLDTLGKYLYDIQFGFQNFQGDSSAYIQYFDQFQKGKNFHFRKEQTIKEITEPYSIDATFSVYGCDKPIANALTSYNVDQTNSYFRIADVKEYKSANGVVFKRDVTIEFDVNFGPNNIKRIKNGRLFFSY
jgi:hypothetical protein